MKQLHFAIFVAAALLFQVDPAAARIGETLEQCIARYGEPFKRNPTGEIAFKKAGLGVLITFFDGKADTITFRKLETDDIGRSAELSDNEIALLLESNGGGRKWKAMAAPGLQRGWMTEDEAVVAIFDPGQQMLYITTKEGLQRTTERRKQEERKKLDGF